jgi:tetratricopeptide (TPR) repeat protein
MNRCLRARLDIDWRGDTEPMERLLVQIPESLDPDGEVTLARFQLKLFQRKYNEALQALTKSPLESLAGWVQPTPVPKPILLALVYRLTREQAKARASFEEARSIMERAVHENPLDASRHALLGQVYAGLGRKEDAIREGKRAVELRPESKDAFDGPIMTLALAQIYALLGDPDSALPLLEHSLATPGGVTVALLKLDPAWDPLRSNPRFEKIVVSFAAKDAKQ